MTVLGLVHCSQHLSIGVLVPAALEEQKLDENLLINGNLLDARHGRPHGERVEEALDQTGVAPDVRRRGEDRGDPLGERKPVEQARRAIGHQT